MRRRYTHSEGGRGPRHRRWQKLREHPRRGIFLLPSLLTTGNLFCGFLALILSAESRFTEAAVAIFVAMVRNLIGTLVEIGRGAKPPEWMEELLDGRDRTRAGPTAPPQGLVLVRVMYPSSLETDDSPGSLGRVG